MFLSVFRAGFIIVGIVQATDTTNLWSNAVNGLTLAAIGLHPHLSFQFLQVLLDGLQEIKRIKPVLNSDKVKLEQVDKKNKKNSAMSSKSAYLTNTWNSTSNGARVFDVDHHSTRDVISNGDDGRGRVDLYSPTQLAIQGSSFDEEQDLTTASPAPAGRVPITATDGFTTPQPFSYMISSTASSESFSSN